MWASGSFGCWLGGHFWFLAFGCWLWALFRIYLPHALRLIGRLRRVLSMLILRRQLNFLPRFINQGPTLTVNGPFRAHRFRSLALFGRLGMNEDLYRQIIHAHVRPNGSPSRYLRLRFFIFRRSLIRHDGFRFPTDQQLSAFNRLCRLIQVRMRTRRHVI